MTKIKLKIPSCKFDEYAILMSKKNCSICFDGLFFYGKSGKFLATAEFFTTSSIR